MGTDLLYTIMAISVLILLLVVIGFICLFKYINKLEIALKQTIPSKSEAVSVQPNTFGEVDVSDDLELVAAITAAIYAYEASKGNQVPENGLYVRSIRKVNKSRWQNA